MRTSRPACPPIRRWATPIPPGLEPVVIDTASAGSPMEPARAAAGRGRDLRPGGIVADYLYVEPDPKWPRLKLRLAPRGRQETDEQYESYRRDIEQFTCNHAIYLGLCQDALHPSRQPLACAEGPCRRNGLCAGIRDQDRFDIPLVLFPPCVPLDREIIGDLPPGDHRRDQAGGGEGNEVRPKAEPATAGRRPPGALAEGQPRAKPAAARPRERKGHRPLPVARPAKTA